MNLSLVDFVRRDPHRPHRKESKNVNVISTGRTVISRSISLVVWSKRKNMNKICNNYDYANNIE